MRRIWARSFDEARYKLARDYFEEGSAFRIHDTYIYEFVNTKRKKPLAIELPIDKVMKKYKETFIYK